jgi:hypothetical protein
MQRMRQREELEREREREGMLQEENRVGSRGGGEEGVQEINMNS